MTQAISLTAAEAMEWKKENPGLLCLDVRTKGEYDLGHPEGFVSYPLMRLLEAPMEVCTDRERPILAGCDGGYRSEIAAARLKDVGYANVAFYGWESD